MQAAMAAISVIYFISAFLCYKSGYYRGMKEGFKITHEMQIAKEKMLVEYIEKTLEKERK